MNKLFLAMLLIVSTPAAFAQTAETQASTSTAELDLDSTDQILDLGDERTTLELRAGLGFGNVSISGGSNTNKASGGMNFGAGINLPVGVSSSFSTGLNFVQKGTAYTGIDDGTKIRLNYLVIPFQMKAYFGHPRAFRWNLGLGPYVGIKTASYATNGSATEDVGGFDSVDLGGRASLGFEIPLQARYSILAGADYDVGVKTIIDNIRTRTLLMSVGLSYEI